MGLAEDAAAAGKALNETMTKRTNNKPLPPQNAKPKMLAFFGRPEQDEGSCGQAIHPLPLGEGGVRVQEWNRLATLTRRSAPPSPRGRGTSSHQRCDVGFHRVTQ